MKALALVLTCAAFAGVALAADPVRMPGTTVSLVPPEGFTPSTRFPGFQNEKRHASIMVTEIDGPVDSAKKGMTKEGLAPGGMTLLFSTTQKVNGAEGLLVHVSQVAAGVPFLKWMLVVGDPAKTRLIVGTFPESDAKELGPAIQAAVLGATWTGAAPKDLLEGLPFRITPGSQLKLTNRVGNSLMFTESGEIPTKGPEEALYVAGPRWVRRISPTCAPSRRRRARQTAQTKEVGRLEGRRSRSAR